MSSDSRNIVGLERDIYCALEHFQNKEMVTEYIHNEFNNDYTKEEINRSLNNVFERYYKE